MNAIAHTRHCLFPAAAMLCITSHALGQSPASEARESALQQSVESEEQTISVNLNAESRLTFRSDLRDSNADVLVSNTGVGVGLSAPIGETVRLTFGVDGELSYYDFENASDVIPGLDDPFEDLYGVGGLLAATFDLGDPWSITVGGLARVAGESDADVGDALVGGGFVAVGYAFSRQTYINLGVSAVTRLEDDPIVVPYLQTRVQITDTLRFETQGLGLGFYNKINDQFEVGIRGQVEYRQFRLDDSRPDVTRLRDGIVRDLRIPIGVELAWKPIAGLTIAVEGGAVVFQEYEFLDSGGDKISDIETEPAPFVGLRVEYRF